MQHALFVTYSCLFFILQASLLPAALAVVRKQPKGTGAAGSTAAACGTTKPAFFFWNEVTGHKQWEVSCT